MKKIKHPFAESSYSKACRELTEYSLRCRSIDDLKLLRSKLANGTMTPELYEFINKDGTMEKLFPLLPPPVKGVACESLTQCQLNELDNIIATEEFKASSWIARIWKSLRDWFLDYWDLNRCCVRDLKYILAQFRQNSAGYIGTSGTMGSAMVLMYRYSDWNKMLEASRDLNAICRTIPRDVDKIVDWVNTNKTKISDNFKEFGRYIDETGNIIVGSPKYIRQNDTCTVLGWFFVNLYRDIESVISAMDDDINIRKSLNDLETLFASVKSGSAPKEVILLKRIIITSKQCSLITGRTFRTFIKQVIRANKPGYRVSK